ncbi:MAG: hypothetical protein IPJ06_19735 [Saprospiraceae bacterium]|nr:hypothetical protein [Saprospiraceae bacterium]
MFSATALASFVATWGKGLNKYVPGNDQFGHVRSIASDPFSLSDPVVTAFYEQENGDLWIGTEGGINSMDGRSGLIKRYPFPKDLFKGRENSIYAIQPVSPVDRRLWLGTTLGLLRFDPDRGRIRSGNLRMREGQPRTKYCLLSDY